LLRRLAGRTPGLRLPEVVALTTTPWWFSLGGFTASRELGGGEQPVGSPFRCRGARLGPVPRRPSSPSGRRARRSVRGGHSMIEAGARVQPPVGTGRTAMPIRIRAAAVEKGTCEARGRQGQRPGS
jgi:hypothetical protein